MPRGTQEQVLAIEAAQRRLTHDRGRAPSVAELAEYLELDAERVLDALQTAHAYGTISLDAPRGASAGGDGGTYSELLGDFDERYELVDDAATIAGALKYIPERERTVLSLRFGRDMTQSEIAEWIGVSQMQVSRLLRRSLAQLRILVRANEESGGGGA